MHHTGNATMYVYTWNGLRQVKEAAAAKNSRGLAVDRVRKLIRKREDLLSS